MKKITDLRIVFMGTPDFAVASLEALIKKGCQIVGVVTATDKLGGRGGKQLLQSAVKQYAERQGLRVLQPKRLKSEAFLEELASLKADLQIVVAFRMLPQVVWAMPPLGTFNLHGSLLPKYRGAAPINWAIVRGESETGVTTFFLQQAIDTGNIIFQERLPIGENETAGELYERMMLLGAAVVVRTTEAIAAGAATAHPQDEAMASDAPKLFHENCAIDFDQPTEVVHNFVRGMSPQPAAWMIFNGLKMKILATTKEPATAHGLKAGTLVVEGKKGLKVATADGFVRVKVVQLEGRKRMTATDFLNGYEYD